MFMYIHIYLFMALVLLVQPQTSSPAVRRLPGAADPGSLEAGVGLRD